MIIEFNQQKDNADEDDHNGDDNHSDSGEHEEAHKSEEKCSGKSDNTSQNEGTLILDATCAPQNIKFPQDVELLNEAREKLEKMICEICSDCHFKRPRMYREIARKDYLAFAKRRKKGAKNARKAIKKQLGYVRRDLGYIEEFLKQKEDALSEKNRELLTVLLKVYEQQKYMYDNKIHTVKNRIVSISQPYIRPIVRGKAKSPVEFGAKLDLSVDENGMSRIEKLSFDAYNEESVLKTAARIIRNEPVIIRSVCLLIRFTAIARISVIAILSESDFPESTSADRKRIRTPTLIRSLHIRTIQTELEWNASSVLRNTNSVSVCWLRNWKKLPNLPSFSA